MNKPYIKKFSSINHFDVWLVDGMYIRANMDKEFTNFGQHYRFTFIPENELWIDHERVPGEENFFIQHMVIENHLMAKGTSYEEALAKADAAELRQRRKVDFIKQARKVEPNEELIKSIHIQLLTTYSKNLQVWLVSGRKVRDHFYIEFTEGGHDKVYNFIPPKEVWIDDDLPLRDRKFVLLHELHERALMAKGMSYSEAHNRASMLEYHCRHNDKNTDECLKKELENNVV